MNRYAIDAEGWLIGPAEEGVEAPPKPAYDGTTPRWTGAAWVNERKPEPAPRWSDPGLDPRYFWLDVGPFRDRFGMDWLALSSSSHRLARAACAAWAERKYIDLKDARNAQLLAALAQAGLPDAAAEIPGSGPLTPAKIAAILNPLTTEAERHIKGMVQPQ